MTKINLNKEFVTKENLLKYITDLEIYQKYILDQEVRIKKPMLSPLRKENNSSFGLFEGENGEIFFNDFLIGGGDCIKFVQLLHGLTYFEALSRIAIDFGMQDDYIIKHLDENVKTSNINIDVSKIKSKSSKFKLGKKSRKWLTNDIFYWRRFGVSINTLQRYNVEPISYYFINNHPIKADKQAYCFIERKDNKETYKIYQPFNNDYKWINYHNDSIWQGWTQLPKEGNKLIITKSLKDVMSIVENLNIPAIALQSENITPKDHIVEQLKKRFKHISIFYDNDYDKENNWGQIFAEKLCEQYGFFNMVISKEHESKDFSDLIKNKGIKIAKDVFNSEVLLPF